MNAAALRSLSGCVRSTNWLNSGGVSVSNEPGLTCRLRLRLGNESASCMPEETARPHAESIAAISRAFTAFGNEWVIIGGVAVGIVAVPRYTPDLDALTILDTADV